MTGEISIKIGTRASKLARLQTQVVISKLSAKFPQYKFKSSLLATQGDTHRDVPIVEAIAQTGSMGVFVKELEEALLTKQVDLVVHSLKDLPTEIPTGLNLAAVLDREDPRDVLVSHNNLLFENLPAHSTIATSSRRRVAQLSACRPDLKFVDIRGNIPTRLKKHQDGTCDAIVLAAAGLIRLDLAQCITQFFDYETLVPAAGQGALAVECRSGDQRMISMCAAINEPNVQAEIIAERTALKLLGGGCSVPIGILAQTDQQELRLIGVVATADGKKVIRKSLSGSKDNPEELGRRMAAVLEADDAHKLLAGLSFGAPNMISPP